MSASQDLNEILQRVQENGKTETTTITPTKSRATPKPKKPDGPISLTRLRKIVAEVPVVGDSPIILHKWSEKALRMMEEKQGGKKMSSKKDPKDPEQEAESCTYYLYKDEEGESVDPLMLLDQVDPEDTKGREAVEARIAELDKVPAVPSSQFKAAIVGAVRFFEGVTMVSLKQSIFVLGDPATWDLLIPFEYGVRSRRRDPVRNQTGVADLRYRYQYHPWMITLRIEYIADVLDLNSVIALVDAAGNGGVGDWRPSAPKSNSGTFGKFHVPEPEELEKVIASINRAKEEGPLTRVLD